MKRLVCDASQSNYSHVEYHEASGGHHHMPSLCCGTGVGGLLGESAILPVIWAGSPAWRT